MVCSFVSAMKRLQKEMMKLARQSPEGVVCYPVNEDISNLEAKIQPMQGVYRLFCLSKSGVVEEIRHAQTTFKTTCSHLLCKD